MLAGCGRFDILSPPADRSPEEDGLISRHAESLYAEHGHPGFWFNPWWKNPGGFFNYYKMRLMYKNKWLAAKSRAPVVPKVDNDGDYLSRPDGPPSITWVGHSTFVIQDGKDTILTDPHFNQDQPFFFPRRIQSPGVPIKKIPSDAIALLSHNHYDHMDSWTIEALPKSISWFLPAGLGKWFRSVGRERVIELNWWETAIHGRWKVTCLPAQHWSRRFGMGVDSTLWCSWLIESEDRKYFFAGDTGYFHGFSEFGRKFGPIDIAMLPIGAYAPRWFMRYSHMGPDEAYRAFGELRARWMVPMHWGTFDLTNEPVDQAPKELKNVIRSSGGDPRSVRLMAIGERWKFSEA